MTGCQYHAAGCLDRLSSEVACWNLLSLTFVQIKPWCCLFCLCVFNVSSPVLCKSVVTCLLMLMLCVLCYSCVIQHNHLQWEARVAHVVDCVLHRRELRSRAQRDGLHRQTVPGQLSCHLLSESHVEWNRKYEACLATLEFMMASIGLNLYSGEFVHGHPLSCYAPLLFVGCLSLSVIV